MGGSVYKGVETSLLAPLLLSASSHARAGQSSPAISSSLVASAKASPKALSNGTSADCEISGKRALDSDRDREGPTDKKQKTAEAGGAP